jgi:cyclic pyranopterin phosphate synthase
MLRQALPGVDLTLTTNGSALKANRARVAAAGLDRLTVSLDSLDDPTFRAMNDADFPWRRCWPGSDAGAERASPRSR